MDSTLLGMLTERSAVHSANAPSPMVFTVLGIVTEATLLW